MQRLVVDLESESGPISGTIADERQRVRRFDGILDLLSAMESLRSNQDVPGEAEPVDTAELNPENRS